MGDCASEWPSGILLQYGIRRSSRAIHFHKHPCIFTKDNVLASVNNMPAEQRQRQLQRCWQNDAAKLVVFAFFFFFLCFFQRYCCMVLVYGVVWFGMVWYASFAGLVTPSAMAMNQRTIDRPEKDRRCRSAALQLATRSPRSDRFQFGEFGAAEKLVLSQSTHNLQHDDRRRKVQWSQRGCRSSGFAKWRRPKWMPDSVGSGDDVGGTIKQTNQQQKSVWWREGGGGVNKMRHSWRGILCVFTVRQAFK